MLLCAFAFRSHENKYCGIKYQRLSERKSEIQYFKVDEHPYDK